ncbi:MAG: hypothetical protein AAFR28_13305 [Pseudomonadota bacterium]
MSDRRARAFEAYPNEPIEVGATRAWYLIEPTAVGRKLPYGYVEGAQSDAGLYVEGIAGPYAALHRSALAQLLPVWWEQGYLGIGCPHIAVHRLPECAVIDPQFHRGHYTAPGFGPRWCRVPRWERWDQEHWLQCFYLGADRNADPCIILFDEMERPEAFFWMPGRGFVPLDRRHRHGEGQRKAVLA